MFIVIDGVKPWDGRYPLNLDADWTARELGWIKRLAGYLPQDLTRDGVESDAELWCVLAAVAMRRAGRIEPKDVPDVFNRLADAPFGTGLILEPDPDELEEDEESPPPPANSTSSASTSGADSSTNSGTSPSPPNSSGIPGSDTSASDPQTLVT